MPGPPLIIEERRADIGGGFQVGRILPFRKKRTVGPFCFIDHMGPTTIGPGPGGGIGQHPHIGLSTLTYLMAGGFLHKDSLGTVQAIRPGEVNWMTAGRGIVHAEDILEELKDGREHALHGYQIWVALPRELEDMEPAFFHSPAEDLPKWSENRLDFTLIAGEAGGRRSPVPVYSKLYLLEVFASGAATLDPGRFYGETGVCVVAGRIEYGETVIPNGRMLVSDAAELPVLSVQAGTHLLLFGGEPLPEKRFIDWNFVSSDKDKLETARRRWQERRFELIEGETSYVPYP